jgi:glycosyltransferase involved in cell wall biosynthesis
MFEGDLLMTKVLSICIPTFDRAEYIGETLESIINQIEAGIEVVIVDGGATDNTESVVANYQKICPDIHYFKSEGVKKYPSNEGFDRDCNYAVELASGEYCWLMTDDDLFKPGAIKRILRETEKSYSVIVASVEVRNKDLTRVIKPRRPDLLQDQIYQPSELNKFAAKIGSHLSFVGAVIVKKQFWLSRNRKKYFGSGFIHVGVIFDKPIIGEILVISEVLVSIRLGNAQWLNRSFEIWMFMWPELVWSFSTIGMETKRTISLKEPWRRFWKLIVQRSEGAYNRQSYRQYFSTMRVNVLWKFCAWLIACFPKNIIVGLEYLYSRRKPESREFFDNHFAKPRR